MNTRTKEAFSFDAVFGPEVSTETVFNEQVKELVHNALDGINQTVFAYGQTSSGKTFTMRGYPHKNQLGLIPLSVREIFDTISADESREYKISVSYIEVSIITNSPTTLNWPVIVFGLLSSLPFFFLSFECFMFFLP